MSKLRAAGACAWKRRKLIMQAVTLCGVALGLSPEWNTRSAAQTAADVPATAQVIGARSYSPMVQDVDAVMRWYEQLGLMVPKPEHGDSYPWDTEAWHYDLHGGQAPRSQMRFSYATVPGAEPPAKPLLVEPVEHRGIERRVRVPRVQDPGSSTLVLMVRELDRAAAGLPAAARQPIRRVTMYGGDAKAMTVAVPGAHLVELIQSASQTTAPADANVIGAWVRVAVADLDRTLSLYRDRFGVPFTVSSPTDASLGGLVGVAGAHLRLATGTLPGTSMRLEFLEVTGVDRHPLDARIQDPGAARIQLTVRSLETALQMLRDSGPSTVVSTNGQIITQPQYRVVVASDLNGLFLVLTDSRRTASTGPSAGPQ
jgi:catechol 2,3-dioxygenase-like lactoylglutathione lyase family enzyme